MNFGLKLAPQIRVFAAFYIYSFCMGSIYPRLPAIQEAMGVGEGALGLSLIGAALGTLLSLTFAGPFLERIGYRRALLGALPLLAVLYAIAVLAPSPLTLFVLLVPVGATIGCIELIVNLEADRVEHAVGFRIMNRAHAFWSFGFFSAGMVGALVAQAGISPQWHLAIMVPVVTLATVVVLGRFEAARHRVSTAIDNGPRFARPTLAILVLVCVTFSAVVMEGAGIDWSAIYMRDVFMADPFWAGFAVALGAGAQAVTRFFADKFVDRSSPTIVARTLLTILGIGTVLVFVSPYQWLAYVGLALMGVGTSAIFPLAMSAAAQRTDRSAAVNVAALAQISFVGFLLGPPLLGYVAEHFGIRWAFGIGLPLIVLSLITASALGSRPPKAVPAQ
ncbi:MFS transporter [Devosia neptuniae]|jgi:MFS family permease|uniref:MFS transporter n=1 Tax=Devosia TaxID=46913 RepID=UPI0022AF653D|nr:MFS transporter [Devosia neptuniae]MCZ4347778.1 MFS transporter [Devosia neptuniae]|tara:strand:- start:1168 stop:2340 length:1173 start_codon:yes stop_codon:yes gene_type:complete